MKKIKVAAVSYLNTKPLLYGIFQQQLDEYLDLELAIPSRCASLLQAGEADLALVPVAIIPELDQPRIVSDYCIGAVGKVRTVCLYSRCPVESVTRVYLDFHSRTSVELVKVLFRKLWKREPVYEATSADRPAQPGETEAVVLIGDKTIGLESEYPYVYDLAEAWMTLTGLPFVFAAWVSNKPLEPFFLAMFNKALASGIAHIPQLGLLLPRPHPDFDLESYFTNNISYQFDAPKREALASFLRELGYARPLVFQASGMLNEAMR